MAFVGALGLVAGALGLVSFGLNNLPSEPKSGGATIRVHAGLGEDKSQTMGGDIWQVFGYDYYNNFLGQSDLSKWCGCCCDSSIKLVHTYHPAFYRLSR